MNSEFLKDLFESVRSGKTSVEHAVARLRDLPYESIGFANVDHHRAIRCGFPEVIFCPGKTAEQVASIFEKLAGAGGNVLATRATAGQYEAVRKASPNAEFHETARCITLRQQTAALSTGIIALVTGGTSDMPVIEEARVTCEIMDQRTQPFYDVGVAGIHRLLSQSKELRAARVVIVAAGMEGALASVVGGLVAAPVIAVPTSVGYGASFEGLAALLAMLNSCATGVAVMNIDNGFGAAALAAKINRLGEPSTGS
ncbi:MAG: nickel pincer cofactor biosynthesis protein LarB [Planctomycetia bacterium]|nr:nickel pincer cofactor biosynthesis protein LarB [Planctomycetia bacterium]MCC7315061.1 nickel pincer cofactor biosynthesis protein LarB [Planctomycetota bacterium]OQZ06009.1 MAG: 1-(5-phosphoribosyl)-5-amino-4-imidazole-carboxylate carboxylase [Planctomycetes bacterium UTPLA1]